VRRLALVLLARRSLPFLRKGLFEPHWPSEGDPRPATALDAAERYADGLASPEDLRRCREAIAAPPRVDPPVRWALADDADLAEAVAGAAEEVVGAVGSIMADNIDQTRGHGGVPEAWVAYYCSVPQEEDAISRLLGLFVRPDGWEDRWRTADAAGLARHIYATRDFLALDVLADALEDVGCDLGWLLKFLRHDDAPRCCGRGVWFLDRLKGQG
jgi:hypothetical protein